MSFAAIELIEDVPTGNCINLIFNPGRKSHPAALRVHGLRDDVLRYQEPFEKYAYTIATWMHGALIVGHNVGFDLAFLWAEFERARVEPPQHRRFCTMERYREEYPRRKASLDAACRTFGIATNARSDHHGAFVDATLAYHLYHCLTLWRVSAVSFEMNAPSNYIEPPAEPIITKQKRRKRGSDVVAVPTVEPSDIVGGNFPASGGRGTSLSE